MKLIGSDKFKVPGVVEKMVGVEGGDWWSEGGEVGETDFILSDFIRLSILNAVHFSDWVFDGVIRCCGRWIS